MAKILIVGCGAIGAELGHALSSQGHTVTGLKRNSSDLPDGISPFAADITVTEQLQALDKDFEIVFFIVSPDQRSELAYQQIYETGLSNLVQHFADQTLIPHWFFVSSSSVYAQDKGEWVDENSVAEPIAITSQWIRKAELKLLLPLQSKHTVVRFSGIYGPGRDWLIRKTQQTPTIQKQLPYYTNRIHQQDCVGILLFLSQQHLNDVSLEPYYLASDDHPAPQWEVISWLAKQLRVTQPQEMIDTSDVSMNKRCSNKRIKALGYQFKYPDYQQGYASMLHR